jgi:hypothetical protein
MTQSWIDDSNFGVGKYTWVVPNPMRLLVRMYCWQIQGQATLVNNALALQRMSVTKTPSSIMGNATGTLAGYSGTVSFRYSTPSAPGVKSAIDLSLRLPSVNVGSVMRAIGPSASNLFPGFILSTQLPTLTFAITSGVVDD